MGIKKRNNYKFSDKIHSKKGILSFLIGIVSLIIFIVTTYISSKSGGNGSLYLGLLGIVAMIMTIYGFTIALKALKEKEILYLFPIIGITLNAILLIFYLILYVIGIST